MNNNKYRLIVAVLAITFLTSSCAQNQCSDGICQPLEERKGSCPEDCAKIIPAEPLIEKAVCGNNICQPEKCENSDNCFSDCKWQSHNPPTSPTGAAAGEITWSPDGKKIIFQVFYDGIKSRLYILAFQ